MDHIMPIYNQAMEFAVENPKTTGLAIVMLGPWVIAVFFALIRGRKYPEKSFKNNLINVCLSPMRFFGLSVYKQGALTVTNARDYAIKKCNGLNDWGEGSTLLEYYERMMTSNFHKKQNFTNLGYISARIELNLTFVRKLKTVQYLKDVPSIKDIPVPAPVFVMGLPRTGTTHLHRLLSLDPKRRAPITWELLNPVPTVKPEAGKKDFDKEAMQLDLDKRKKFIQKLVKQRQSMGDNALKNIHTIAYDLPEECLLAITDEMPLLTQFLYTDYMNIETFLALDSTQMYSWYKKQLQLLSYQIGESESPRGWMLKCPVHLFYIKIIGKIFPDAKIVWTHRHPNKAVPSLCSLIKAMHQLYFETDGRDDKIMGNNIKKVSCDLLRQAPIDIEESGLDCGHVKFTELMKDPVTVVKKLYKDFQWEYTDEYDKILNQYLEDDAKLRQHIGHSYSAKEYGIDEKELNEGGFAEYTKRFC